MIEKSGTAYVCSFIATAALMLVASPSHAEDDYFSPTDERVRISLGVMHVSSATAIEADSSAGVPGTRIDGEQTFGLEKSDFEPKFQATVRVAARHRLSFDYFSLDRSGNTTLAAGTAPIVFRDVIFLPGDPLQTKLSLRTFGITYAYSFWHSEAVEIAGTLGVHISDLSAIAKVQTQTRHVIQTDDQAGPVPTAGFDATWVVSKHFYFDGRAQYLKVNVHDINGSLGIFEFDALYRFRPNVSFAVGYSDFKVHLADAGGSQPGRLDFNTKGPEMFFRVAF